MKRTFCNRCGKVIDQGEKGKVFPRSLDGFYGPYTVCAPLEEDDIDLCYDCQLALQEFLDGKEIRPILKIGRRIYE